jgi:hypothetical protein
MREGVLDVRLVDCASGATIPEIQHDGKNYAIAMPGLEFRVETTQHANRRTKTLLWIDGDKVDHMMNSTKNKPSVFPGYPLNREYTQFSAFKFAATEVAEPGHSTGVVGNVAAGTVRVEIFPAEKTAVKCTLKSGARTNISAPAMQNVVKKGEKFFKGASLSTQAGSTVSTSDKRSKHKSVITGPSLQVIVIHTETQETLRLRGVPVPPGTMAAFFTAGGGTGGSGSGSGSTGAAGGGGGGGGGGSGSGGGSRGVKRDRSEVVVLEDADDASASAEERKPQIRRMAVAVDDDDDDDGGCIDLTAPEA